MEKIHSEIRLIVDRLKKVLGVSRDDEVAKALGMSPQSLNGYKDRRKIPYDKILEFCEKEDVSLDHVILGKGQVLNLDQHQLIINLNKRINELEGAIALAKELLKGK
jgi:hypothetical protein